MARLSHIRPETSLNGHFCATSSWAYTCSPIPRSSPMTMMITKLLAFSLALQSLSHWVLQRSPVSTQTDSGKCIQSFTPFLSSYSLCCLSWKKCPARGQESWENCAAAASTRTVIRMSSLATCSVKFQQRLSAKNTMIQKEPLEESLP